MSRLHSPGARCRCPATSVLAAALLLVLGTAALAQHAAPQREQARIEYLIASVELMHDAQFVRNGSVYDAHAAADHMRRKLRFAGTRVQSAEDFIRYCASSSSVTGRPYEIRFADGQVTSAAAFLTAQLVKFDRMHPAAAPP
ncbi:MAG: DUF5329 family protein [Gammaproteobacteria bacterium]|nr:DUF5329 family protein [Gammaproteobacteria bacterium]